MDESTRLREEFKLARRLTADLFAPRPWLYWCDFLASALVGWSALVAAACAAWPLAVALWLTAVVALYRATFFVHELTHGAAEQVPGLRFGWNALVGVPFFLPSIMYEGVHTDHHRRDHFGTWRDPEYLPLSGRPWLAATFLAGAFLVPILLAFRFLVAAPLSLAIPPLRRWLERRGSAFAIHTRYERSLTSSESRRLAISDAATFAVWACVVSVVAAAGAGWTWLLWWYATFSAINFVNAARTLTAHRYDKEDGPTDFAGQIADSLDTVGGWWTELWAPLGARYHAVHHLLPAVPYHNLGAAYRRICAALPEQAAYRRQSRPSAWASLRQLLFA